MNLDWQLIGVLLAISLAGSYVARHLWRMIFQKETPACGGCAKCGSDGPKHLPLVTSDSLEESAYQNKQ